MPIHLQNLSKFSTPVSVVLTLLVGYVLAQLALDLLPQPASNDQQIAVTSGNQKEVVSAQRTAQDIANIQLFGDSDQTAQVEAIRQDAPETKLNLTLRGVLAFEPPEQALAIISTGGQKEVIYAIGDSIVSNTTLRAVHADCVIIKRSGNDEKLCLPEKTVPLDVVKTSAAQTDSSSASDPTVANLPTTAKGIRERLLKDPAMLTKLVTMHPYTRNGQLVGFRIQPKADPSLLANFGIQQGDVITSVNGIALTSNHQGITALTKLRNASSVELIVLRGGAEIPISVSMQ